MNVCSVASCGGRVFDGDAHPCCVLWEATAPGQRCIACLASETLNREQERRERRALRDKAEREKAA